jgi:ABC-type multidrug transport system fused ATPase/permease subunit
VFFTYAVLNSQQSVLPDLSIVKAFGFFISGTACVFVIFYFKESIVNLLCSLFNLLVITSVILPARLTTSNATLNLHAGILNHSQSYGYLLICALPLYLLKLKYDRKSNIYNYVVFFLGLYCVYLTGMRTAYFAIFSLYLIVLFWDDIYAKNRLQLFFAFFLLLGSFFTFGRSKFFDKLIDKRGTEVGYEITSRQEMLESRNKLLAPSLENFRNHPVLGIGFGVPTEATQVGYNMYEMWGIKYFPGTNIVISFPTEKGVLYSLILEELGIIGFALFIMILIRGFVKKNHNLLLLIPLLTLSFGEGGLFSLNGIGIFGFILLLISVISDNDWSKTFAIQNLR